jgi:hypothetical protein
MARIRWTVGAALLVGAVVMAAPAPLEAQNRDRNLITQEELDRVAQRSPNLYQAVRSLRSHMVDQTRGAVRGVRSMDVGAPTRTDDGRTSSMGTTRNTEAAKPVLYVDDQKQADFMLMRDIQTIQVAEVKYLDSTKAMNELGLGHEGGAILVKLRKPALN